MMKFLYEDKIREYDLNALTRSIIDTDITDLEFIEILKDLNSKNKNFLRSLSMWLEYHNKNDTDYHNGENQRDINLILESLKAQPNQ